MDVDIEYENFPRKISKYDIDRQYVNMKALKREKEKERTDNVKVKSEIIEREIIQKKLKELEDKNKKIESLAAVKIKQDLERRETVK